MLWTNTDARWIGVTLKLGVIVTPLLIVLMAVGSLTPASSPASQHHRNPRLRAGEPQKKLLKQIPAHQVFSESGDEFWYMNRGSVNPARIREEATTGRSGLRGPVPLSEAELLQFDGTTHALKRIYAKPDAGR